MNTLWAQNRWHFLVAILCIGSFATLTVWLSSSVHTDYYDGYSFLDHARRMSDPSYASLPPVRSPLDRPRALVAILFLQNAMAEVLFNKKPRLEHYHYLMCLISAGFLWVWYQLFNRVTHRSVALIGLIGLTLSPLLWHYSFVLLNDILTGLSYGVCLLFLTKLHVKLASTHRSGSRYISAMAFGFSGALLAICKNHYIFLFPTLLSIYFWCWNKKKRKEIFSVLALSLCTYLIAVEILLRTLTTPEAGWMALFKQLILQSQEIAQLNSSMTLYLDTLIYNNGVPFLIIVIISLILLPKLGASPTFSKNKVLYTFLISNLIYLLLTQFLRYREVRYLLPLLPGLLICAAWVVHTTFLHLKTGRVLYACLICASLLIPIRHAYSGMHDYTTLPIYKKALMPSLWHYLKERGPHRCQKIIACGFSLRGSFPQTIKEDPYYRRYDIWNPHFIYNTQKPTQTLTCRNARSSDHYQNAQDLFGSQLTSRTCYVFKQKDHTPFSPALVVVETQNCSSDKSECFNTHLFPRKDL